MTTYSSDALVSRCCYSQAGVHCRDGMLFRYIREDVGAGVEVLAEPETLEGSPLQCPMCEGKGQLLTSRGRELLIFMDVFARPLLRDLVDELFEERKQH